MWIPHLSVAIFYGEVEKNFCIFWFEKKNVYLDQ